MTPLPGWILALFFFLVWAPTSAWGAGLPPDPPGPAPIKQAEGTRLLAEDFPPPPSGDRGFDVLAYDLDFRLDSGHRSIDGSVVITARSLTDGLAVLQLDLVDELTCEGVSAEGVPLAFTHGQDALLVILPAPLALDETVALTIQWQGQPPRHGEMLVGLLFRHHNAGTLDDPSDDVPIIANLSEPWSAHSWWPCKDHPADKALVSLAVTVPDTLSAVSNGTLLGVDPVEPGWHRYRWQEAYPVATYLVGVAVSNYEMWSEDCVTAAGTVPLEYYVFPQDRLKAEHDFAPTCAMMEFMTDLVGGYPFSGEKYAQVEIKWTGAMEHTTATSISQLILTGDGRYESLILHELSHHWFGDSLTPASWADIWLNEGFARYCEALWSEFAYGRPAYLDFMDTIGRQRHPEFFTGQGLLGDPAPILPNILVYDKGAWLLHSLREFMGDDAFFGFLQAYATDPDLTQGTVRRQDMMAVAESFAATDLGGFFTPWLETDAVPVLWWEHRTTTGGVRLALHQLQDPVFQLAVPVRLETACGPVDRKVLMTHRDQEFLLPADCQVQTVTVDPDTTVFMFAGQAPPRPLTVLGPFPNPMESGGGDFSIYITDSSQIIANIYDMRGRLVQKMDLGNVEATGPMGDEASVPATWSFDPDQVEPRLPAGVYWLEFLAAGHRDVRKMTLIH